MGEESVSDGVKYATTATGKSAAVPLELESFPVPG
jgi:hypothetical protein